MCKFGDRVTYRAIKTNETKTILIESYYSISTLKASLDSLEILKIERPKYEVVEEKKELLTQEEKQFLRDMIEYFSIDKIKFDGEDIDLYDKNSCTVICMDYPASLKFKGVERCKRYTLKELGLE